MNRARGSSATRSTLRSLPSPVTVRDEVDRGDEIAFLVRLSTITVLPSIADGEVVVVARQQHVDEARRGRSRCPCRDRYGPPRREYRRPACRSVAAWPCDASRARSTNLMSPGCDIRGVSGERESDDADLDLARA